MRNSTLRAIGPQITRSGGNAAITTGCHAPSWRAGVRDRTRGKVGANVRVRIADGQALALAAVDRKVLPGRARNWLRRGGCTPGAQTVHKAAAVFDVRRRKGDEASV